MYVKYSIPLLLQLLKQFILIMCNMCNVHVHLTSYMLHITSSWEPSVAQGTHSQSRRLPALCRKLRFTLRTKSYIHVVHPRRKVQKQKIGLICSLCSTLQFLPWSDLEIELSRISLNFLTIMICLLNISTVALLFFTKSSHNCENYGFFGLKI